MDGPRFARAWQRDDLVAHPRGRAHRGIASVAWTNGGSLEHAQEMAAHESPRTTKLYDRTQDRLTQDEVERIKL